MNPFWKVKFYILLVCWLASVCWSVDLPLISLYVGPILSVNLMIKKSITYSYSGFSISRTQLGEMGENADIVLCGLF